ncbi:ABC transporter ATP-binding protein [Jatrophihabitans sp. DSM 45814]
MSETLFATSELTVRYGGVVAVDRLSFTVSDGEVFVILGANGAGKTSTLRAVSRLIRSESRTLTLGGQDLRRTSPHEAARRGLRHVPEGRRVFPQMTVKENLELGGIGTPRASCAERMGWVFELFPRLLERSWQPAGLMSGGEQQMLAIGRALMREPTLLLLDEPSLGLSPEMMHRIYDSLAVLKKQGVAMVLVEQNAEMALRFADRGCVLALGTMVHSGSAADLRNSSELTDAYLGSRAGESSSRTDVAVLADPAEVTVDGVPVTAGGPAYRHLWRH